MTNEREFEATMNLKDNVEKRLSKKATQELWRGIFERFENGGESLVRTFVKERFDSLKSQILSKIEEIKKHLPED
jgi:hypothetical protein